MKLAPRQYGLFKVIWASPTNCRFELPMSMKIHPVFHNSLLKPYYETWEHRPNYERPAPKIVNREEGHYEIESILQACPTQNRKSTQYLVKWKGYPESKNLWLPEKELTSAKELLEQFKQQEKNTSHRITNTRTLQVQWDPKEGILSWTESMTLSKNKDSQILSQNTKITQETQKTQPAHDSEK